MDRAAATGAGFIGQFRPAVAKIYESLETCPDNAKTLRNILHDALD
jgi:alpha-glucuronidase